MEERYTVEPSGNAWVVMKDGQAFASFSWNADPRRDAERMAASFNEACRVETARLFARIAAGTS